VPDAASLESAAGRRLSLEEMAERVCQGFERQFSAQFEPRDLLPDERDRAAQLAQAKYRNDRWNYQR
jgi:lipoate-protein ligase A